MPLLPRPHPMTNTSWPVDEAALWPRLHEPEQRLLETWRDLSSKLCGSPVEVMTDDVRKHIVASPGELNIAVPANADGRLVLMVALEMKRGFDVVVWGHELAHWILRLQGFFDIRNEADRRNSPIEVMLNSMGQHRGVYQLQRDCGREPQAMIDDRAAHQMSLISRKPEALDAVSRTAEALLLADDALSCSSGLCEQLTTTIHKTSPQVAALFDQIMVTCSEYDSRDPAQARSMMRALVQRLRLGNRWSFENSARKLQRSARRAAH